MMIVMLIRHRYQVLVPVRHSARAASTNEIFVSALAVKRRKAVAAAQTQTGRARRGRPRGAGGAGDSDNSEDRVLSEKSLVKSTHSVGGGQVSWVEL